MEFAFFLRTEREKETRRDESDYYDHLLERGQEVQCRYEMAREREREREGEREGEREVAIEIMGWL